MKHIEIVMRAFCFCFGVLLALSIQVKIHAKNAAEVFANALFALVYIGATVILLVLPWALPLRN